MANIPYFFRRYDAIPNNYIRTRAHEIITKHFGEKPNFNTSLVVAQAVKNFSVITDKSQSELEYSLHVNIYKSVAELLKHNQKLTSSNPAISDQLINLETTIYSLRANLKVSQTEEQLNQISRRTLQIS